MNTILLIITEDSTFPNLFHILLSRKISDLIIEVSELNKEFDEIIKANTCKLIILDGKFSKIPPLEILQYIRQNLICNVPIWFFTEVRTKSYIDKAYKIGANRLITKPFDPYIITSEIAALYAEESNM